jgi:TonB-dependent starch-binding outer membrane protein SusC
MNYFSFYKDGKALYCLIFTAVMFTFSSSFAVNSSRSFTLICQQHRVQGIVTDGNFPLPGVTIVVKGNKNGAITDYNGQFNISADPNDTLFVSFIGFKTKVVPVNNSSVINIKLEYDTTTLQEVRVNAGYYSVKEKDRTGSIARITSKDIETQPVTNVLATMQGRMAGVSITQTTGVAGGGFEIKIRGQNSIRSNANAPLYIIDDVPYSSDPIGSSQTSTIFPTSTSPLNSINPETIESIEVLKDADATSIYGSRGANGVVLITTKKGKTGKTKFSIISSTGIGKVTKFLKLMDTQQYLKMRKQAFVNDGITEYNPWDYDINGTWDQNRNTDWQKELLGGSSQISEVQGTLSGGSEQTQFMINGNYHHETTVFPGDFGYKKGGAQINLNHRSENNRFWMTFSAGYNVQNNLQTAFDLTNEARFQAPNAPQLYNTDGTLNWENGTWENPLRNLNAKYESKTKDVVANTLLSYEITTDLTIKTSFGYTDLKTIETRTSPSTLYNPIYNVSSMRSSIYSNNTNRSSWIIEPQLNWEKVFSKAKLGILAGGTFQSQTTNTLYQSASGFSSNSLIYNLAAAKFISILQNNETQYKYHAFFARVNYNLMEKYIVNLTARRDGSSRFGPGNQFATFGAVGAAWLFSNENFLKDNSWISFGKIRSSYGAAGNDQIGDYQFLNTYTTSGVNYNNIIGLEPSRLFNPDFAWEINKKLEFAVELGFLNDRIFATASWYQNRSSNQLVGIPLAGTTGFTLLQSNLDATVQNRGTELTLRTINFNKGNFKWSTNFNLTFTANKLLAFPGLESSPYNQQYRIGEPLNIALLYKYKGINLQKGVYEVEDVNKDGIISFPDDRQTIADLNPKFYGGLQNQFEFKRWKLDFLFQFVKQTNRSFTMGPAGMMSNQQARIYESWQASGDNARYQIFTTGYNNDALMADYYYSESTATLTDASFIRLKNISLSYDLPINLKESSCRIMLQGQNLLTFTKFKDGDPEFTTYGYLPPLKVVSLAVQLTF